MSCNWYILPHNFQSKPKQKYLWFIGFYPLLVLWNLMLLYTFGKSKQKVKWTFLVVFLVWIVLHQTSNPTASLSLSFFVKLGKLTILFHINFKLLCFCFKKKKKVTIKVFEVSFLFYHNTSVKLLQIRSVWKFLKYLVKNVLPFISQ